MKILIVEDEPSLCELMARTLRKEQYVVETASTFTEASRPLIAHAVNGLDVGRAAVGFNLAANPANGSCQGVFIHKPLVYIP